MEYAEFLGAVAGRAGVEPDEAAYLIEAVIETLTERIDEMAAGHLAAELPPEFAAPLIDTDEPAEPFEVDEFVRRMGERAGVNPDRALEGTRAVLATLRDTTTGGAFEEVLAQLPPEFTDLIEPVNPRRLSS